MSKVIDYILYLYIIYKLTVLLIYGILISNNNGSIALIIDVL